MLVNSLPLRHITHFGQDHPISFLKTMRCCDGTSPVTFAGPLGFSSCAPYQRLLIIPTHCAYTSQIAADT